jgi:hypothetical protein
MAVVAREIAASWYGDGDGASPPAMVAEVTVA